MKQPLWIVNSALLLFVLFALIMMYFFRVTIPEREDIEPKIYTKVKKETIKTNIAKIYESDLFGTYQPEIPLPTEPDFLKPFPEPPQPLVADVPELPAPKFLDPLNITLKGIFVVSTDNAKNRAIIQDNKTSKEVSYKVGDQIEGAQLIRIYSNKIIFLRPNGQQEVLYLREQDAKSDPAYAIINGWEQVVQQIADFNYMINPSGFVFRITNLAQFIELLGLTTAYKQGKSIGCRIGQVDEKSLGASLGLQTGDIVTSVEDIPATTTENRLKIYQTIVNKKDNDTIKVQLLRNKQDISLNYVLKDFVSEADIKSAAESEAIQRIQLQEKENILKQKYHFAPTMKEIRKKERQNMLQKGQAPATIKKENVNDK